MTLMTSVHQKLRRDSEGGPKANKVWLLNRVRARVPRFWFLKVSMVPAKAR